MSGRTTWWAKDAAWLRRERIVILGTEHGPGGATVLDALSCWAQEQRAAGCVRGGFHSLAREAFVTVGDAESVVRRAAEIGALDDLQIDDDGIRFTCRVSGWTSDQERGRAAFRMARMRSGAGDTPEPQPEPEREHSVTSDAGERRVTPSPLPDQTNTEEEDAHATEPVAGIHPQLHEVLAILRAAPGLDADDMAVNSALMARQDCDALELAQVVASWAHEGGLHNRGANRLLLSAAQHVDRREAGKDGARTAAERRGNRHEDKAARGARNLQALEDLTGGSHAVV